MKVKPINHHSHDLYVKNIGACSLQPPLPLPPNKGLPFELKTYADVDEPRYDAKIHLQLEDPAYVRVFPNFEAMKKTPPFAQDQTGSKFAYSSPFQVFSQEGMDVLMRIIKREEIHAVSPKNARGSKFALRGLYYLSPFVRDLQKCQELRNHFCNVVGEEIIPHPSYSNSPQVNLSVDKAVGPVDVWHYDSIAYTGVVLLNDVESMDGGELEIMNHDKHDALDLLAEKKPFISEVISYEKPGKMILAQGSEVLHHVTPVTSDGKRISLIFGYGPANSFQPPKTILRTMQRVDVVHQMATYEFFREKAWQGMHCLKHFVEAVPYTTNGAILGEKIRTVADELMRSADLLEEKSDDTINVFDELKDRIEQDYTNLHPTNRVNGVD